MRRRILIVSASMGAGHDGAARELKRRLEAEGHEARIVDFLDCCPFGIGWFIKWSYLLQLRFAPWSYDLTYRLWYKMPSSWGFIVRLDTFVAGRRRRRAITDADADAVVSTYPLSSLVLGNMRKKGWLRVPVVTFLTDFAVHPLWVHPHVDLHVATSPTAAKTAEERGGRDPRAPGPLVADRFRPAPVEERRAARRALGLAPDARAVLVVAGSWGVGDVPGTVDAIARVGGYHPVVVCGRDEQLKVAMEARAVGTVIGWTDEMPQLMAACDAMVENAGGLTANEAFAIGLPVVTFLPIAGHGKDNADGMAALGVTRYARDEHELAEALALATTPGPERDAQIDRARSLFAGDAKADVLEYAQLRDANQVLTPITVPKTPRRLTTAAAALLLLYGGLTIGAQGVSALGVGLAQPPRDANGQVFVGVRLTAEQLRHRGVRDAVDRLEGTAIVDGQTARAASVGLRRLVASGVDLGNGGWGKGRPFRYLRAQTDVAKSGDTIRALTGVKVREFVPERRIDAFDQMWGHRRGQKLVEPDAVFKPEQPPVTLRERRVYVLDGRERDATAVEVALRELRARCRSERLSIVPLSQLR
jgi:UDP-N-acetylglucosamine:LPS N-acetylglucosamine transferase